MFGDCMDNIIYYDLNESVYLFSYDNLRFYFSSKFYLEKFKRLYVDFIKNETLKLSHKYKCHIYCDEMVLLTLYKNVEKRGFRVEYKGHEIDEDYIIDASINNYAIK